MNSGSKPYGIRGELSQSELFKTYKEEWSKDGIDFLVENSCIEMSFENRNQSELAKRIANHYALKWSIENDYPLKIKYNMSWEPKDKGRIAKINLKDKLDIRDHITTVTIDRGMFVIGTSDSMSFSNNDDLVNKSLSDPILEEALKFYSEEVLGDENPLYGIYKAIEVITKSIGDREKLANIAGVSKNYIGNVTQTADTKRHAIPTGKRKLTDAECRERAKKLILAYADSIV